MLVTIVSFLPAARTRPGGALGVLWLIVHDCGLVAEKAVETLLAEHRVSDEQYGLMDDTGLQHSTTQGDRIITKPW
uniref:Putative secreted protein n=1 Tax=Anopheles triannulatus TaxID=58253 RepID=A0A2M4B801_9DIPT